MDIDNKTADKLIKSQAEQISLLQDEVRMLKELVSKHEDTIRIQHQLLQKQQEVNDRQQKWIDEHS